MFSVLMITRSRLATLALLVAATTIACDKVPLLAPSGSTIVLTASNNAIPATGTVELIAQVLEPSGTPPHNGTHVSFTTTLGVIEPADATTDVNGQARVRFRANGTNGTATITASSGGASTGTNGAVRIFVGTAAVGRVIVNATPATIPSGGTSSIVASIVDVNGSALANTLVSFSTDAGALSSTTATTNGEGVASTTLTTSQSAVVTASVGASGGGTGTGTGTGNGTGTGGTTTPPGQSSGQAKITVVPNTTVTIGHPASAPSAGLPATFTFTVTVPTGGNPVRDLRVNWGDGTGTQSFGAVNGAQNATHVYDEADTYILTATAIDVAGVSQAVSTSVTVIPVPRPTVLVTATPQTQTVNGLINVSIQITVPQGIGVVSTQINFGDGDVRQLGGATSATVQKRYSVPGGYTIRVLVLDTTNEVTEGTTIVSITP